jgi:protein-tyrosine phosphatase
MNGFVDFHSHLIPGVDDGAQSIEDARAALTAMRAAGIEAIITTPHVDGSLTETEAALAERLAGIDAAWERLRALAGAEFPDLRLERGAEIMLDTPSPDLSDLRLRLAGGRYALVEFPFLQVPPSSAAAIRGLTAAGVLVVIAHPERYAGIGAALERPAEWRDAGAYFQANYGSLSGRYGPGVQRAVFGLLERGWLDFFSTDYHARGRLHLDAARAALLRLGGEEQFNLLSTVNPRRLLEGELPLPVAPLRPRPSLLGRVFSAFR